MKYLRNVWYVAALAQEVKADALFHRKILDTSVLLYRKADGRAVALHDRCPHRFAPLHLGKRHGDDLACLYHGLRFNEFGRCVGSPHGDGHIPKAASVRSFPVVERDGFLWIWMAEPVAADASLIPDYSLLTGAPPHSIGSGYIHMPANYEIVVDNIMDLSHVDFVHGPLLSTAGKLSPVKPQLTEGDRTVTIRWEWNQDPPMGFFAPFLRDHKADARHWVQVCWTAPGAMLLSVGAVQGDRLYEDGLISWDFHIMTPESERTTHYFFATRRNWLVDDPELNLLKLEGTLAAFTGEDQPLIAAVQEEIGTSDLWSVNPVLLASDPGAIRARRKLQFLLQQEA